MIVIDTNVLIAADGPSDVSPACAAASAQTLLEGADDRYVVDNDDVILMQYEANVKQQSRPWSPSYEFLVHVYQTQWDDSRCERVALTPHDKRGYVEFPADPRLEGFDPADRVFAAVARHRAPIHNATDSDWWNARAELLDNGIEVVFLCRERFEVGATIRRSRPRRPAGVSGRPVT